MNKIKSILVLAFLATVAATNVGCYTEHERHRHTVYEPSGSGRHHYDRDYRYERDRYYQNDRPGVELRIRP